ncbi:MAG: hypothetical protein ACP5RP_03550 [Candidatus Micrarchaeia archaeon]
MAEITKQAGISSLSEIKDNPNYKRFIDGFGLDLSKSFSSLNVKYKEIFTDEERVDIFKIEKKDGKPFGQIEFHGLLGVKIRVEEGKNLANLEDTVERIIKKRKEKMKKNGLIPDIRR